MIFWHPPGIAFRELQFYGEGPFAPGMGSGVVLQQKEGTCQQDWLYTWRADFSMSPEILTTSL